jgi:hypothetical protein
VFDGHSEIFSLQVEHKIQLLSTTSSWRSLRPYSDGSTLHRFARSGLPRCATPTYPILISPTNKRTEERSPVWGSELLYKSRGEFSRTRC